MITTQLAILCNHCTHSFSISRHERYTTCPNCGTHLMIEESEQSIATVIVSKRDLSLELASIPVQADLTLRELKQELQIIKADWKIVEEQFKLFKDTDKKKRLPTRSSALMRSIGGTSLALVFFFGGFDVIFLGIMGVGWAGRGFYELYYWNKYNRKKAEHQEQLRALQENISYLS